jgi:hypothetical protein
MTKDGLTYIAAPRYKTITAVISWLNTRIDDKYYVEQDGNRIVIKDYEFQVVQVSRDFVRSTSLQFPKFIFEIEE